MPKYHFVSYTEAPTIDESEVHDQKAVKSEEIQETKSVENNAEEAVTSKKTGKCIVI